MILGITGSRDGLTDAQQVSARAWLEMSRPTHLLHGACVGADCWVVLTAKAMYGRTLDAEAYPGHLPKYVSHPSIAVSSVRHEPANTLARNRTIVERCDRLLALPSGPEKLKSGTWATVRYGRKLGRPITLIWPDGKVTDEN